MSVKSKKGEDGEFTTVDMKEEEKEFKRRPSSRRSRDSRQADDDVDEDVPVGLDMENRDPENLHESYGTAFHDVIGEPDDAHSTDCVFVNSYKCFNGGKGCCYKVLTLICSLPLALCWGCQFACITFCNIWHITPCLKAFNMQFSCFARLYDTIIRCCCDPCYESMALMFTRIFVHRVDSSGYDSRNPEELNRLTGQNAKTLMKLNQA